MTNKKNNGRLHSDRTQTENDRLARGIASEKWIQAKQREFKIDIEQHTIREKQTHKAQVLLSFEITVTIAIICAGIATLLTRLLAPGVMDEADITYFRGIGFTSVGLLVMVLASRLWRKRIQRNLHDYTQTEPKG